MLQRPHELELAAEWLGRARARRARRLRRAQRAAGPDRRDAPPGGRPRRPHARPRHPLQRAVLGRGRHADARDRARHRRPRPALHRRAAARGGRHQRGAPARAGDRHRPARRASPRGAPLDLFGMDAATRLGRDRRPAAGRLHAAMARAARVYLHPIRWTSLGLSLLEAMHLGMPVVAARRRPRPTRPCRPEAGVVSTRVDVLADALRRLVADPDEARERGAARPGRRARALRARALPRRLGRACSRASDGGAMRIAMVSEHASPLAVLGGVDAGGQNVHVAALAHGARARRATTSSCTRAATTPRSRGAWRWRRGVAVDHVDAGPPAERAEGRAAAAHAARSPQRPARAVAGRPARRRPQPLLDVRRSPRSRPRRGLGIPVVHTFHALGTVKRRHQGARDTSPPRRLALERDDRRAAPTAIVATCTDEVFELMRHGRRPPADHGRAVRRRPRRASARDGPREPRPGRRRLVAACRLVERKGIGDVVAALAGAPGRRAARRRRPDAAGAWTPTPRRAGCARSPTQHGVGDRLVLRGRVGRDEMPALLRSADAVVCAPWYEPFGIVPLEAMACGVPVVATAVGGQIDSVVDGVTGVHVPPRDPPRARRGAPRAARPTRRAGRELGARRRAPRARSAIASTASRRPRATSTPTSPPAREPAGASHAGRGDGRDAFTAVPAGLRHLDALRGRSRRRTRDGPARARGAGGSPTCCAAAGGCSPLGNGGSAAQAQHLTAELVGRYRDDRAAVSARSPARRARR